jgi:hypothetical protein
MNNSKENGCATVNYTYRMVLYIQARSAERECRVRQKSIKINTQKYQYRRVIQPKQMLSGNEAEWQRLINTESYIIAR